MESTAEPKDSGTAVMEAAEEEHLSESLFHSCADASEFFDADDTERPDSKTKQNASNVTANDRVEVKSGANSDEIMKTEIEPKRAATSEQEASNSSSVTNSSWNHLPTPQTKVNSITFNRERTCLLLSTSQGVRIRTLESFHYALFQTQQASNTGNASDTNYKEDEWVYDIPFESGVTYAQLLHKSSILAVILPNSPRCCFLYNAKNATHPLAALPMSAAVKRVELNKKVLVCITADGRLHIFHMNNVENGERPTWIQTLNVMHPSDSVRNIRGNGIFYSGSYFDLSPKVDECYLVCKSFNGTSGTIRVYDPTNITEVEVSSMNASVNSGGMSAAAASAHSGEPVRKKFRRRCHLHTTIDAHEHQVTRMVCGSSSSSSFVATASSKGTTVRVFSLPHGQQLYEWHRGSRSCQILSLSWNGLGDRLISHGSSNTIHVFEWNSQQEQKNKLLECSHADARDFDEVREEDNQGNDATNNASGGSTVSASNAQFFKRIGATIRRHTVGSSTPTTPLKHRSFAKLKYHPTVPRDQQQLIVAMLDRHDPNVISGSENTEFIREDTVATCSSNGELRQYSVKKDGASKLVQMEDLLVS